MDHVVRRLANSREAAVALYARKYLLGDPLLPAEETRLRDAVRESERVVRLLGERDEQGRIPSHPYSKWDGAHWVLVAVADIGYPSRDPALIPLREQVLGWLTSKSHRSNIPTISGKVRRCASQEGNAVYALLSLGLGDERVDRLAGDLVDWQWPDGGWNCDRRQEACHSSFEESLIPMRALALHGRITGNEASQRAAGRAAEMLLERRLFRRRSDGQVIKRGFTVLHHPCYWHYDILFALEVLGEMGILNDERCVPALELLESKRLPDGGFPAEERYWQASQRGERRSKGRSLVEWGPTGKTRSNEFVTVRALSVLLAFDRG